MQERENVLLLATLYVAAFVAGFNENLVNMALMSIMAEYSVDSVTAQWLVTGYMIVSTVVVSCMAFLYRRVKLRTLFLAAAILSLGGSVIGLFASSFAMLMAARLVQAVGTGIFIPAMMNSILAVIPKNRLGTFMSIGGCVITFGPAFAPVVCGALVTSFGWHSIFVLPAVVMVLLIGCCFAFVRNLENYPAQLDIPSVALSAVGLTAFVYGMAEITANVPLAVGALAVALASIVGFAHRQFHCESPLIELVPMKSKRFVMPLLLVMMAMMTTFSMSVLLPLYFEGALGMTALFAGVVMLVPVLSNAGATLFGGRFMDKRGEWPLLPAGFACIVVGLALMIALGRTMVLPGVFAGAVVVYAGVGLVMSPSQTAGLKNLPPQQNPFGVTLMSTCLQIAACIGPSLFVGVMSSVQVGELAGGMNESAAVAQGFSVALAVAAVIATVGLIVAFLFARPGARVSTMHERKSERKDAAPDDAVLARIMETNPYTLPATACVKEAISLLMDRKVSGVPVVDGTGRAVGFLSDGDIMRYLADHHPLVTGAYSVIALANQSTFDERLRELVSLPVGVIATEGVVGVSAGSSLEDVCSLLARHKLKKVPVLDDGRVVGTVNRSDVLRYAMGTLVETRE